MKKGLIGLVIVSFVLVFTAGAMAAEFSWSGDASFGIEGTSDGAAGDFFGSGDLYLNATATSGAWGVGVELGKENGDPVYIDPFITYTAEAFTLTLDDSIDNGVFDTEVPGIPANPGLKLEIPMEAFTPYVIVNNVADDDEVTYNFAGGADFTTGAMGLGVTLNSNGEDESTSYGVKATYSMDALSLTGEYGVLSPKDGDSGSGYYAEVGYSIAGGGSFTFHYSGADENIAVGDEDYTKWSEIYGEFTYPIAESVDFTVDVTSTNAEELDESITTYEAKVGFSF